MKRTWTPFFADIRNRSLRLAQVLVLIPLVEIIMDPELLSDWTRFSQGFWVGIQVVGLYFIGSTILYGMIFSYSIDLYLRLKRSWGFKSASGLGLLFSSFFLTSSLSQGFLTGLIVFGIFFSYSLYSESKEQILRLRAESAEARLRVLQSQMQPHFLFNSLNSIVEMVDSKHELAGEMVQNLADIYREILISSNSQTVSLEKELEIVSKYLKLEKIRFQQKLTFDVSCPSEALRVQVPTLIIQTLVENAIKHGGGEVRISVSRGAEFWLVRVTNNLSREVRPSTGLGTGISNTVARLELLCKDFHGFSLTSEGTQMSASFKVPHA